MSFQVNLQAGDLVIFSRKCSQMPPYAAALCVGAKYMSWSAWDHVGMVIQDPETNDLLLLEANMQGITAYPVLDRFRRTRADRIAVRKLIPESGNTSGFTTTLWNTVQKYMEVEYNTSLSHMAAATYASHTRHTSQYSGLRQRLLRLNQEIDYLHAFLAQEGPSETQTLLGALLQLQVGALEDEGRVVNGELQGLHISHDIASADTPANPSNKFYCSQLIAQVLMDLGILSGAHRRAHEYLPADFSSSTQVHALQPHIHVSVGNRSKQISDSAPPKYSFAPDIVIEDPTSVIVLPQSNVLDESKSSGLTLLVPPPNSSGTSAQVSSSPTTSGSGNVVSLQLHAGDRLTADMCHQLTQMHHHHDTADSSPALHRIALSGEVLVQPSSPHSQRSRHMHPLIVQQPGQFLDVLRAYRHLLTHQSDSETHEHARPNDMKKTGDYEIVALSKVRLDFHYLPSGSTSSSAYDQDLQPATDTPPHPAKITAQSTRFLERQYMRTLMDFAWPAWKQVNRPSAEPKVSISQLWSDGRYEMRSKSAEEEQVRLIRSKVTEGEAVLEQLSCFLTEARSSSGAAVAADSEQRQRRIVEFACHWDRAVTRLSRATLLSKEEDQLSLAEAHALATTLMELYESPADSGGPNAANESDQSRRQRFDVVVERVEALLQQKLAASAWPAPGGKKHVGGQRKQPTREQKWGMGMLPLLVMMKKAQSGGVSHDATRGWYYTWRQASSHAASASTTANHRAAVTIPGYTCIPAQHFMAEWLSSSKLMRRVWRGARMLLTKR